ncbi:hypothetical protein AAHE18_02G181100 [Arachis hypogaea]
MPLAINHFLKILVACFLTMATSMQYRNGSNIKGYFVWPLLHLFDLLDDYKVSYGQL